MDYFGINSADDLPKIKEILDQEIIEATKIEREDDQEDTGLRLKQKQMSWMKSSRRKWH